MMETATTIVEARRIIFEAQKERLVFIGHFLHKYQLTKTAGCGVGEVRTTSASREFSRPRATLRVSLCRCSGRFMIDTLPSPFSSVEKLRTELFGHVWMPVPWIAHLFLLIAARHLLTPRTVVTRQLTESPFDPPQMFFCPDLPRSARPPASSHTFK